MVARSLIHRCSDTPSVSSAFMYKFRQCSSSEAGAISKHGHCCCRVDSVVHQSLPSKAHTHTHPTAYHKHVAPNVQALLHGMLVIRGLGCSL